jgi:V/A-type H+-transporting ATPase subunit I
MQKVAVVAHRSKKEELLAFLHAEGVMQITDMPDVSQVTSDQLPFHGAELEHVIALLTPLASQETLATLARASTVEQISQAGQNPRVKEILDRIHALEQQDADLKRALADLEHGRLPSGVGQSGAEEGVYFTAPKVKEDLSRMGADAGMATPELVQVQLQQTRQRHEAVLAELKDLSVDLPLLVNARQFVRWLDETEAARRTMKETRSTVTLFGWIAKQVFEPLERKLHKLSPATALVPVEPDPGEVAPVTLNNPKWLKPFESVTTLYGLPMASEIDPTPLLAPFFILFFGLCLTDAGYGLVLAALMGIYLWKKKLTIDQAPLWWLLFIGGIVTFFVSIPFGGWFGLTPDQAPAFMTETRADGALWFKGQVWNLGANEGIAFFQNLSLVLGLIHLSFGFFMAGFMKWRTGDRAGAFWVDWTTLILFGVILGYVFAPAALKMSLMYGIYAALALVVWGKGYGSVWYLRPLMGLLGLLNLAMGMLSNTLSYLRLLALGLVTGALALAVNLVAQQISGLFPIAIGLPIAILIYLVGHTVNIALNVLGAFIHSGRLQFVEFFGNFFEGGGRPFAPFKRSLSA